MPLVAMISVACVQPIGRLRVAVGHVTHRGCAVRINLQAAFDLIDNAELLQDFRDMNAGGGSLGVRHEDRVRRQKRRAQGCCIGSHDQRIGVANGERGFDLADILHRCAISKIFAASVAIKAEVRTRISAARALAQLTGHRADRAELARDIEAGLLLELGCEAADEALRRAAAQNVQAASRRKLHGRDQAIARDRQVAKAHAQRVEHGVCDRRRHRAVCGLASADRIDLGPRDHFDIDVGHLGESAGSGNRSRSCW